MGMRLRFLVVTICWSLFSIAHLSYIQSQTSTKPADTVQRFFALLGKGETDGIETLFLLPGVTSNPEIKNFFNDFKRTMVEAAREFKQSGGMKSLKILREDLEGEHAKVNVELTRGDGSTTTGNFDLIYSNGEWKIDLTRELTASSQIANETAAILSVQAIAKAQILYSLKKGQGKFADLATLGKEQLIDSELASGEKQGYLFTSEPLFLKDQRPVFDITATPKSIGAGGTGNRSFYSNETMVVYEAKGGAPPTATTSDRGPKNGTPIQ
jgi:hypothetical protein